MSPPGAPQAGRPSRTLPASAVEAVLVGSRDVVAPEDELASALSPRARLEVLEGLNHFFSRGRGASETDLATLEPALDHAILRLLDG